DRDGPARIGRAEQEGRPVLRHGLDRGRVVGVGPPGGAEAPPVQGGGGEQQAGERDPLARGGRAERGWGRRRQAGDGDGVGRNGHGTSSPTGAGALDAVGAGVAGWCPAGSDRRTAPAGPRAATAAPPSGVTDYARGRWTVNSVRPGRLVAVTVPPWAAVTARTIARPRPVLPLSRDRGVAPRANRSEMGGRRPGGGPGRRSRD